MVAGWLLDSIERGRRLPEAEYLPKGLVRQHGGSMAQYFSPHVAAVDQKQAAAEEEEEEMEEEEEVAEEEEEVAEEDQDEDQWIGNSRPPLRATASLPPRLRSEIEPNLRTSVSLPSKPPPLPIPAPVQTPRPHHLHSTTEHRGAASDPNFINSYFETSRLHFLGSWKARLPALRSSIQKERESSKEFTQLSLPFPIGKIESCDPFLRSALLRPPLGRVRGSPPKDSHPH